MGSMNDFFMVYLNDFVIFFFSGIFNVIHCPSEFFIFIFFFALSWFYLRNMETNGLIKITDMNIFI